MKLLDSVYKKKAFKSSGSSSRLYLIMRSKFILSFLLLIIIPFLTLATVMHIKNAYTFLAQNDKHISADFDSHLSNIESFLNLASGNIAITDLFEKITENPGTEDEKLRKAAEVLLTDTAKYIQNVKFNSVYVLRNNKVHTIYTKYDNPIPKDNVFGKKWYKEAMDSPEKVKFIGTAMQFFGKGESEYVFSAVRAFENPQSGKPEGLLVVDFDYSFLDKAIDTADSLKFSGRELYIINQDSFNSFDFPPGNTIMYSNTSNLLTSPADTELLGVIGNSASGTFIRSIEGKRNLLISFTTSSRVPWKIVYTFPAYKIIFDLMPSKSIWFFIILICLIMVLAFPFIIHWIILKPINRLTTVITEYEKGSFPTRINLDNPNNEENKQMSPGNIDNLINKVYYNQLKQKEAELNSLQNKINPHFLYNTLESIRGAALYHGIDSIASMAKSLSLLFRYSINNNVLVTVREEMENLENYITIQNFRFDDKFEVIYNIPEKVYEYKILKLILQPIVENSIKHGLEMKLGKGMIKVTFSDLGSIIKIEISDDGTGISPDRVVELNRILSEGNLANLNENGSHSGTGIGIQNVNSRIKLYFGDQYGIKFRNAETGATVEIMLPAVE